MHPNKSSIFLKVFCVSQYWRGLQRQIFFTHERLLVTSIRRTYAGYRASALNATMLHKRTRGHQRIPRGVQQGDRTDTQTRGVQVMWVCRVGLRMWCRGCREGVGTIPTLRISLPSPEAVYTPSRFPRALGGATKHTPNEDAEPQPPKSNSRGEPA